MEPPQPVEVEAKMEATRKPLATSPLLSRFSAHHFSPAPGGVDSNLLILLHGLGDTDAGFFTLGKTLQKTLPQTAVLTLQAPHGVPFLDPGRHWMWYPSFDQFGEMLTKPNPTPTVHNVTALIEHLIGECGWSASHIHFFGFGQGATIALETLVAWTKSHEDPAARIGSVVSIAGQLISHPTLARSSATPVLHIYRSSIEVARDASRWASIRKATSALQLQRLALAAGGVDEAMLRGNGEWDRVMEFWSRFLRSRSSWEVEGKVVPLAAQK